MDKPVIIFGSTGLANSALDIFESNGIEVYGFLEDNKNLHTTQINNIPILGATDDHGFLKLIGQKCEAFIATDDNSLRKKYVEYLKESRKVMPMNAVHPSAIISKTSSIGHGNFINACVILSNDTKIGQHNVMNSKVLLEQEVEVSDFVQIGAGSIINAKVKIEEGAFVGSGVTVVAGVSIGKNARIGAGSVVVENIEKNQTVFGNPAVAISSNKKNIEVSR